MKKILGAAVFTTILIIPALVLAGYANEYAYQYAGGEANQYANGELNQVQTRELARVGNCYALGEGNGPLHDILSGTPFAYEGYVVTIGPAGEGMVLAVEEENITIYGIGPLSYWEDLGVARPLVGEFVDVTGYTVDFNGVERNIAMSMIVGEEEVVLRNPDTGVPLWRQGFGGEE